MVEPPGATGPTGDWEKVYATSDVATLPWYNPDLDADIECALKGTASGADGSSTSGRAPRRRR